MEKVNQVSAATAAPNPAANRPAHESLLKPMTPNKKPQANQKVILGVIAVIVTLLGIGAGKILASTTGPGSNSTAQAPAVEKKGNEAGMTDIDESQVDDQSPEGVLKEGGAASGEGTFHLERTGGVSQNVYLTSTVLNLADFVDKKVKVWGQTSASKAGWLMDVVKIKEIE